VRKTAYIREKEGEGVRKAALPDKNGISEREIPPEILRKVGSTNGHGKLRGQALFEHNLAVISRAGL
jgi:hypothetical protein